MPYAAALSTAPDAATAAVQVSRAAASLDGRPPDLAVLFFSAHHFYAAGELAGAIQEQVRPKAFVGCMGEAIVGTGREVEDDPAVSLWLADFGGAVAVEPFHLQTEPTPDGPALLGWPDGMEEAEPQSSTLLVLGDPYTFDVTDAFFPRVQVFAPGLPVVGGMSSGSPGPGKTLLVHNGEVVTAGAVGALLRGGPRWRTVVSQGCRPVGRPLVVTKGRENLIQEVGGQPPLAYLTDLFQELPPRDRQLLQRALHVGLAMTELKEAFGPGDFLIRNLMGLDQDTGALAITDRVRVGQTIQFHVRDADTADEELTALLRADRAKGPAAGALLFTCNGRGTRMFSTADHDAAAVAREVGPVPTAGLFAAGEFGPVGGANFIHGFTASVVLFE